MIKDNQQYFNKLHVLIDALVIIVSYVFAWWLKFLSGILDHEVGVLSFEFYMRALLLIVPVYILLYYAFNLYTSKRVQGRRLEFSNIVMANTVGLLLMFAALFTLTSYNPQYRNFSREMLFYFYVTNIVVEEIVRLLIRRFLRSIRRRGYNLKHILLVGYSRAAEQYIDRIQQNPQWGYNVRGVLDDNIARGTSYKGVKVIGSIGNLNYILPQNSLDEIAITLGLEEYYKLEKDFEGPIELESTEGGYTPISGDSGHREPKKDPLTVIIDKINEKYGTHFTEMDKVLVQMENDYANQEKWQSYAKNNDRATFMLLFEKDFPNMAADRYEQNDQFFRKLFDDPEMMKQVMETVGSVLYQRLKK